MKDPKGGIYRHQEKGGQGDKPWPDVLAQWHQYSHKNVAKATFLWLYQGGARSAACCALPAYPLVGCMFWFLDLGPQF